MEPQNSFPMTVTEGVATNLRGIFFFFFFKLLTSERRENPGDDFLFWEGNARSGAGRAEEAGARLPLGLGVTRGGGARRPAKQRGQGAGSPTCRSPGERRRRPQPLGSEGTGAASPTRQKPGDRGSDPNPWEARGEKERSQLVRSEAATSKSRQKTHRSGSLGRRLHPAARLRSAKAPEEEGAALRAEVAGKPVS